MKKISITLDDSLRICKVLEDSCLKKSEPLNFVKQELLKQRSLQAS